MRLAILGGGGFRVPLIHRELIRRPELGVSELVLFDVSADRLAVISAVLDQSSGPRIRLTDDLPTAVTGADFVFSAIRVGGLAARAADERRAVQLGLIGQETVGAAGLSYALRTIPVALQVARTVADLAPSAWLINFTNPAGLITEASRTVLGNRVIGICDSPAALVQRAGRALSVSGAEPDYAGLNHLGWLRSLTQHGVDRLPELLSDERRLRSFEEGRLFSPDLLRALGALPNEYLYFYYHSREMVSALQQGSTRGEVLAADQARFYDHASADPDRAAALWEQTRLRREQTYLAEARTGDRDESDLAGGGYELIALQLMQALAGAGADRLILNVANGTTFPSLPPDLVVETVCTVDAGGARPRPAAGFTLHQLGLIAAVRAAEQAALEAALTGSFAAALQAFTVHPLIGDEKLARSLLSDLLSDWPDLLGPPDRTGP